MSEEAAKAIVIQTSENEHIGFTLFHPNFGAPNGDCVFVIAPQDSSLFEAEEVKLLAQIKEAGEHQWTRSDEDVTVTFNGIPRLKYERSGNLVHLPSNEILGIWFPAKGKK